MKNISNATMKRYAAIGSPCLAPLARLKYCDVTPPFMTQLSFLFNNVLIQSMKKAPKPNLLRAANKNW